MPDAEAETALTPDEVELLDRLKPDKPGESAPKRLGQYLTKIAKLGGYLGRNNDGPPGHIVMWRGLSRLADILYGAQLSSQRARKCG